MILVPVKNLSRAKQRLAGVMPQAARTELAKAMLWDVLSVIAAWGGMPCSVVSSDAYACELAARFGLQLIDDPDNPGETRAIERATHVCVENRDRATLVLPADIPLIATRELDEILRHAPARGSLLVPAADKRGTNAAFRSPADLFPLRFGNDSFQPHLAAAQATGLPCVVLDQPGIAIDVDRPEDLQTLAGLRGDTRAQRFVREYLQKPALLPTGTERI